jgi:hypothetical protein
MSPLLLHGDGPDAPQPESWPPLPLEAWRDTYETMHRWTQVVGKIRLAHAFPVNHWWHVPLYLTGRGLTTSTIPYGRRHFQIDFDFLVDLLIVQSSDGEVRTLGLESKSVADFYAEVMSLLDSMRLSTRIWTMPVEIAGAIPFEQNRFLASYDGEPVSRDLRRAWLRSRLYASITGSDVGTRSDTLEGSFFMVVATPKYRRAAEHRPSHADGILDKHLPVRALCYMSPQGTRGRLRAIGTAIWLASPSWAASWITVGGGVMSPFTCADPLRIFRDAEPRSVNPSWMSIESR